MATDHIFIEQLTFDAILGVLPHERVTPQRLIVDLQLETDCIAAAAASDALADTLDYAVVAQQVEALCVQAKALLVETLVEAIAHHLLKDERIKGVSVRLSKPDALAQASSVGVQIYRHR